MADSVDAAVLSLYTGILSRCRELKGPADVKELAALFAGVEKLLME